MMSTMHYQPNTRIPEGVCSIGVLQSIIFQSLSLDKVRDDVNLKLKRQQCKYQPNTPSSSPRNILN